MAQLRQGVVNVLGLLQRLDAPHLAMLGALIPYGAGGDLPVDRLASIVSETSDEQFAGVLELQQPSDANNKQQARERQTLAEQLCNELGCSSKELAAFGPLLQLRELCEMLAQFDEFLLMAVHEALPEGVREHQRQIIVQLQEFFEQMPTKTLCQIHETLQRVAADQRASKLREVLVLQPQFFHLYQPVGALLALDVGATQRIAALFTSLKPVQVLQLVALRHMDQFDILALYSALAGTSDASSTTTSNNASTSTTADPSSVSRSTRATSSSSSSSSASTSTRAVTLSFAEHPNEACVYRRNVKPHPTLQLSAPPGLSLRDLGPLLVTVALLRCDTNEEISNLLAGATDMVVPPNGVVAFKRLKILSTSHQLNESLFALRFEVRAVSPAAVVHSLQRPDDAANGERGVLLAATQTMPLCVVSHSSQLKKETPLNNPTVQQAIPATGPSSGGTRIALLGSNFVAGPTLRVRFGTAVVPVGQVRSAGTLVLHTPPHPVGAVDVSVSRGAGEQWTSSSTTFTYHDASLTSASPHPTTTTTATSTTTTTAINDDNNNDDDDDVERTSKKARAPTTTDNNDNDAAATVMSFDTSIFSFNEQPIVPFSLIQSMDDDVFHSLFDNLSQHPD